MTNPAAGRCLRCGAVVPGRSTEDLCPACLLSGVLEASEQETRALVTAGGPESARQDPSAFPTRLVPETSAVDSISSFDVPAPAETRVFPSQLGDYRLLRLLGQGGMGTVYEAEQLSTGRRVALKLLGEQIDSPEMRQRFLREGRLAAGVNHPNSLYVFGSEEIDGTPVITMEIAGSGTLQNRLEKRGPLPVAEAVDAILDVIAGLESAFSRGVLHRDIKPSNCFVNPDGSVKVGDFGLSVSTMVGSDTFVTATGTVLGTPAFASPEQLRGDALDLRSDIYSVGATLFTLLTNRAPFEGDNAIQVVANAVNQKPRPVTEFRPEIPNELAQAIDRCLAKEPDRRFPDYPSLRNALLPFSSREPEPASLKARVPAGWIDYLMAFLPPYVTLMVLVGPVDLLQRPVYERSLYAARYYLLFFGLGFLYFSLSEGIWGAGLGKRLKGLQVVRSGGRPPGVGRALLRIVIPILSIEIIRMPLSMAFIRSPEMTGFQVTIFILLANVCAWIPVLLTLTARRENGYATAWDLISGTRVVVRPKGSIRPTIRPRQQPDSREQDGESFGPYRNIRQLVPGSWMLGRDPALRRDVWLLKRESAGLSIGRREVARPGRLRWLQKLETEEGTWDAFEATPGTPFSLLIEDQAIPWSSLRHWLHDLAAELWDAGRDKTLPSELSLDHIWITDQGRAILLDRAWPETKRPAEIINVQDLAGRQRFLNAVAACVDATGLPVHARPVLSNLRSAKFEKLSFLTGVLRGMLDKPAEVSRGIRAGSIFMMPIYIWILVLVGVTQGNEQQWSESPAVIILASIVLLLAGTALFQLLELPFRTTVGLVNFRLAVVDEAGNPAGVGRLLRRWAITWLPLFVPLLLTGFLVGTTESAAALTVATVLLAVWGAAAVYAVVHPHRGLHDRLAGTWVVRQ